MTGLRLHRGNLLSTILMVAAAVTIGCEQDRTVRPTFDVPAYSPQRPFYYYQSLPVYLVSDPSRLVVFTSEADPASAAQAILADLGIAVQSATALTQAPGHFVLRVGPASPVAVATAAARLRGHPNFGFALPAYRGEDYRGEALFLNRVNVRFRDGTARRQIDSIVDAIGGSILREPRPDSTQPSYWSSPRATLSRRIGGGA